MKGYRDRSGLHMSTGNFYRELQRLVGNGLVRAAAREPDADARRSPYEILAAGRAAFLRWLGKSVSAPLETGEDAITARAMFLDCVPREAALRLIEEWKEELWMASKTLERDRQAAQRKRGDGPSFSILSLLLTRRLRRLASDIEFLDELRATVLEWHAEHPEAAGFEAPPVDADGSDGGPDRDPEVDAEAEADEAPARARGGGSAPR